MSYTKGPWEIDTWCNGKALFIVSGKDTDDEYSVAEMTLIGEDKEQDAINACLIAAAPDLLEALEEVVNSTRSEFPYFVGKKRAIQIREIIAKAKAG